MNPLFDFTVDKATATIYITREFAADLDLVWDAFTKAEMLDPVDWDTKPYRVQYKGERWISGWAVVGCMPWYLSRTSPLGAVIVWPNLSRSAPSPALLDKEFF